MNNSLLITSSSKKYSVDFVEHNEALINELSAINNPVVIMDRNVERLYPYLCGRLKFVGKLLSIDATEQNKTLAGAEEVLKFFQSVDVTNSSTIIAIGGGVLQDIVSFAAHVFYRGLDLVLVPTTLLAMCDSCIGGKSALNFHGYKNQIGAFHPPTRVIIWPGFLKTLPDTDIRSGYGEILKYSLLSDFARYTELKQVLAQDGFNYPHVVDYISHGLQIKQKLVEEDEFDTGVRRLLNYGHTFGHALERATDHHIPHGVAVAWGIDIANYIAWQRKVLNKEWFDDIHAVIKNYFPYDFAPHITAEALVMNAERDKKIRNGKLNMVLMENVGKFRIESIVLDEMLVGTVRDYLMVGNAGSRD